VSRMLAWLRLTCEGAPFRGRDGRDKMKYMIMTFGDMSGLEGKSPEWIKEMIEFMHRIDVELTESGELVFQQGLRRSGSVPRTGTRGSTGCISRSRSLAE
jgi:hypothetical protein